MLRESIELRKWQWGEGDVGVLHWLRSRRGMKRGELGNRGGR